MALAPDLYHGEVAEHDEMDKAAHLIQGMPADRAARVRGHMAEHDNFFGPEGARALEAKLKAMGKDVSLTVHAGTDHAFMGPHNALGTLNEALAAAIWPGVHAFLHETLG